MEEKEYITVSEFAKRTGITKQAVYSRLDKGLKQFVKEVDGRKMLDIKALDLYSSKGTDNQPLTSKNQPCSSDLLLETLNATIQSLSEQLKVKDTQIETLTRLLDQQQRLQALQQDSTKLLPAEQTAEQPIKKKGLFKLFNRDKTN